MALSLPATVCVKVHSLVCSKLCLSLKESYDWIIDFYSVCDKKCVATIAARSDVFSAMFEHEMEERKHVSCQIICTHF